MWSATVAILEVAAHIPEPTQPMDQHNAGVVWIVFQRPAQRDAEVVVFALELGHPGNEVLNTRIGTTRVRVKWP